VCSLYDKITQTIQTGGGLKRWLFHTAYSSKLSALRSPTAPALTHALWDRLVFSKVKARLGGRVRLLVTGSAPIAAPVRRVGLGWVGLFGVMWCGVVWCGMGRVPDRCLQHNRCWSSCASASALQ
jgi:hypothetical protein